MKNETEFLKHSFFYGFLNFLSDVLNIKVKNFFFGMTSQRGNMASLYDLINYRNNNFTFYKFGSYGPGNPNNYQ